MEAIKDLFSGGHDLLALGVIAAATVLTAMGVMTVDQWQSFTKTIFIAYASAKTGTEITSLIMNKGGSGSSGDAKPPADAKPAPALAVVPEPKKPDGAA